MRFVVFGLDKPNMEAKRSELGEAHRAYLATAPFTLENSGPLVSDDDKTMIGSLIILEAPDCQAVKDFFNNDPFYLAGLYATREIRAYRRRI